MYQFIYTECWFYAILPSYMYHVYQYVHSYASHICTCNTLPPMYTECWFYANVPSYMYHIYQLVHSDASHICTCNTIPHNINLISTCGAS